MSAQIPAQFSGIFAKLKNLRTAGGGWQACCPSHDDAKQSLSIKVTDGKVLLKCHANQGCTVESICQGLGVSMADLFLPKEGKKRHVCTYKYIDEHGKLLFEVVRQEPKAFYQRRPARDGDAPETVKDGWVYSLGDTRRVLYRLPELLAADKDRLVVICEGEKDADRLASLGFLSTTSPHGAGKWRHEYASFLEGRNVAIIPDYDIPAEKTRTMPGFEHAWTVLESVKRVAKTTRIVLFGQIGQKLDISNWLDSGGTADKLRELIAQSPVFRAETPMPKKPWEEPAKTHVKAAVPGTVVRLSEREIVAVATAATMATCEALAKSKPGEPVPWANRIEQALAEFAVGIVARRSWRPGHSDILPGQHKLVVRRRIEEEGELPVFDSDPEDSVVVLVRGLCPEYRVIGWITAKDARRPEWEQSIRGRRGWYVPGNCLHHLGK